MLRTYLFGPISDDGTVLEFVAYEGYKFVGIIVALIVDLLGATSTLFWLTFTYYFCANFYFLARLLPCATLRIRRTVNGTQL